MDSPLRDALFGFALSALPSPLLQFGLDFAAAAVQEQHPSLGERLRPFSGARIAIDLEGVSRSFLLAFSERSGRVSLCLAEEGEKASARITGSLSALFALLEGNADGDALFFARDLALSGDTEAVVALRNALDNEEIDLFADLFAALGPFALPARAATIAFRALSALAERAPSFEKAVFPRPFPARR